MTSLPQTRQRALTAQESRGGRTSTVSVTAESSATVRERIKQALPAIDPSSAFGCVDWFLYPDQAVGRSVAEHPGLKARA